jgi:S-DNA-T family DNA segregation ATPase FtsK/SpoIIIE
MAKKKKKKKKLSKKTWRSIFSVAFGLLAFISIFSFLRKGVALIRLNQIYLNYLGLVSVFLPFLFLLIAVFFSRFKTPLRNLNVVIGTIIFLIGLLGLFKSGRIGWWIWQQSAFLISAPGGFILFAALSIIGLVVLFNTSLEQLWENIVTVFQTIGKYIFKDKKEKAKQTAFISDKKKEKQKEQEVSDQIRPINQTQQQPAQQQPMPQPGQGEQPAQEDEFANLTDSSGPEIPEEWEYPPLDYLRDDLGTDAERGNVRDNADTIEETLDSFGITARVKEINRGPAVTQYALEVALGTKLSKITSRATDLALALAAPTGQIRIEAPIPGRSLVGVEVPNKSPAVVSLKEMLTSDSMKQLDSKVAVPLGIDVSGDHQAADIKKMPHVLIAGQTGAGKSVLINSWISTMLFRTTPEEVRMILVDPKRVELQRYNDIPHLLTPVITEPEKVVSALKWAVSEMDRRYELLSEQGARNLEIYNQQVEEDKRKPYILIIIDELADIMLFSPTEVEDNICRIAQMARATGIHLVLATQRPSVDVLTGLIKANIPTRLSFAVASSTDSRVILDTTGAEKLLGNGDMLYIPPDQAKPTRIQGPFVTDEEVNQLIAFLKQQGEAEYKKEVVKQPVSVADNVVLVDGEERDEYFDKAKDLVINADKGSASLLQRKLRIGYARAARILDQLERAGIVGPPRGSKARKVIAKETSS